MSVLSKHNQMFGKADTNIFASDLDLSKKAFLNFRRCTIAKDHLCSGLNNGDYPLTIYNLQFRLIS
jgi:hypothetical protein